MIYKYIPIISYEAHGFRVRPGESILVHKDMAKYPTRVIASLPAGECANVIQARVAGILFEFAPQDVEILVKAEYKQIKIEDNEIPE